jgi:hypothetical protein
MWHALDDSRVRISFFLEVLLIAFMEVFAVSILHFSSF